MSPALSRRRFIATAGGAAGAAAVAGGAWAALVRDGVEESRPTGTSTTSTSTTTSLARDPASGRRVLVVLELAGGNDALNTLVPAAGRYRDARPTLAVPEQDLVGSGDHGLHPALAALAPWWESGSLAAVVGVAMTDQSRSHFEAMDAWWSASADPGIRTGWLGRWLDATAPPGEPDPLRAIALGGGQRALLADEARSTVVHSPEAFALRTPPGIDNDALVEAFLATSAPLSSAPELAAAQTAIPSTLSAVDLLGSVMAGEESAGVTSLLQTAAGIIDLDIGTRVITVGTGGFDTHADQAARHGQLLTDVGDGVAGFFERLEQDGNHERVMLVTTSEFGRRVAENGSGGTDHGTGGLQFLCGAGVAGGRVVGEYDLDHLVDGDLPATVDTRSVYAAALDWLGGPTDDLLDGSHDRLGLLSA